MVWSIVGRIRLENLIIGLVQCNSLVGEKDKNLKATIEWVKKAKKKGVNLVSFPELNITGHAGHPLMISEAESIPDGNSCQALMKLAQDFNIYIVAGIAEEENGIHYNTQFMVGPQGFLGKQRKIHLSGDEYFYFRHGTRIPIFNTGEVKIGIIICYDNLLPEVSRCLAVQGAELLLCPHAARFGDWPLDLKKRRSIVERNKEEWKKIHRARAYDNGCYVALCNAVGKAIESENVKANHAGGCMIIDPEGNVIKESKSKDISEELVVFNLKGENVRKRRMQSCFNLRTRRVESFTILTQPTE